MRRLTSDQLAGLAMAALVNARRLFDDAEVLREAGRIPSSFALLGLAADELGKHVMVASVPARKESDEQWRTFWKRMGRHEAKLGNSLFGAWMSNPNDLGDPPDPGEFHRQRLSATYVDIRNGIVERPDDMISLTTLTEAFASIGRHLQLCERMLDLTDEPGLADAMDSVRAKANEGAGSMFQRSISRRNIAWMIAISNGVSDAEAERFAEFMADYSPDSVEKN